MHEPFLTGDSVVMVQGITGKEGTSSTISMIDSGVNVACGVTPKKGGQLVEGKPVFDTVKEAVEFNQHISISVIYVPPLFTWNAVKEAIDAGIKKIVIIAENVPIKDTAKIITYARKHNVDVLGPASVGYLDTMVGKIGSIGHKAPAYTKGNVAIISKSGGMCSETASILSQSGFGQSIVVGIGGDPLIGTTYSDLFAMLERDDRTEAIVLYCEIGGTYEEEAARAIKEGNLTKPVIAYVSGLFAESLGRSVALGHAGAIIEGGRGTAVSKKKVLRDAGVIVADYHYEIPELVRKVLKDEI